MNTDTLQRHYGALSATERYPLIVSALARGDTQEWERLCDSAPRRTYRLPDYHGLADAFIMVGMLLRMRLLELATGMYMLHGQAVGEKDDGRLGGATSGMRMAAYLMVTRHEAWRRLCVQYRMEPEFLNTENMAREMLEMALDVAGVLAYIEDEARLVMTETSGEDGRGTLITVESQTAEMRGLIETWLAKW